MKEAKTDSLVETAPLRGVNLGGWLVLEKWMTPSLFEGTTANDEFTLCQQATKAKAKKITEHRNTFVTRKDFVWLKKNGITAVRLPIGYWLYGNEAPYLSTVDYINEAFLWAKQTGIKILLDIHGAPGSQNGQDHSGRTGSYKWHKNDQNIIKTLDVIDQLARRYKSHPSLLGFELLNEPSKKLPKRVVVPYYQAAYKLIRDVCGSETWVVFSDGFKPKTWQDTLQPPKYRNVFIDTHQYQAFGRKDKKLDLAGHLEKTLKDVPQEIRKMQKYHPVVVGEWSLALDAKSLKGLEGLRLFAALRAYSSAQLIAYENTSAWFYWNYKTEEGGAWSFRDCIEKGLISIAS
jgi:glucan 1,3-beta-glucosidase